MKSEVRVTLGIVPSSYESFEDAVEASRQRTFLLKEKAASINGKTMINYAFNGSELSMKFENGEYLTITTSNNLLDMDVVSEDPIAESLGLDKDVSFVLPSGITTIWKTAEIMNQLLNKRLVIAPSDQYLFLYEPGGIEYMFSFLVDAQDKDKIYLCLEKA